MTSPFHVAPALRRPLAIAAFLTILVTGLRLGLELAGAPSWLANAGLGGAGALVGISWLPLIFGPWFALEMRAASTDGRVLGPVAKALWAYGLLARIPVVVITVLALLGNWGTHYELFPFEGGFGAKIAATLGAQFVFWASVWTPLVGLGAAWLALRIKKPLAPEATAAH